MNLSTLTSECLTFTLILPLHMVVVWVFSLLLKFQMNSWFHWYHCSYFSFDNLLLTSAFHPCLWTLQGQLWFDSQCNRFFHFLFHHFWCLILIVIYMKVLSEADFIHFPLLHWCSLALPYLLYVEIRNRMCNQIWGTNPPLGMTISLSLNTLLSFDEFGFPWIIRTHLMLVLCLNQN